MAKVIRSAEEPELASEIEQLQRLKWLLWHGNVFRALQTVGDLEIDLDVEDASPEQTTLLKAVREFGGHKEANAGSIPNYGERHRAGEAISTAFVESTVNQVISKRMVKKQQMGWTPRGAHLLLQVRTRVLNDELADDFHRWHPPSRPQPSITTSPHSLPRLVPLSFQSNAAVEIANLGRVAHEMAADDPHRFRRASTFQDTSLQPTVGGVAAASSSRRGPR